MILSKKENVGRILASKKDVLRAYRELNRARLYAQSYPKNCLAQMRLSEAEKAFAEALERNFGCSSPKALHKAENALTAFIAVRKKGIKIANDRLLWELLATMETGEFSLSEYDALDNCLWKYGFRSRRRMEQFLQAVDIDIRVKVV